MATSVPIYLQGNLVRFSNTVRDYAGALTNTPTLELILIREETGEQVEPAVTNTGSGGAYYADSVAGLPGHWWKIWVSSGSVQRAEQGRFYVEPRRDLL